MCSTGCITRVQYLLRDVAAALEREEKYAFDKMIYAVSSEQDLYFQRVFRTLNSWDAQTSPPACSKSTLAR